MNNLTKKFYALNRRINLSYSDFLIMPVYLRESIIDILVGENNTDS